MAQLRYYDEADIQKIADSTRALIGADSRLTVTEIGDYLQNKELADRRVPVNSKGIYVKHFADISLYRNGVVNSANTDLAANHTLYPKLTYTDGSNYSDYIFSGWFTDMKCTTGISNLNFSGPAYAKFIPIDLLVPFVLNVDEIDGFDISEKVNVRWVGTIPDLNIKMIYFKYRLKNLGKVPSSISITKAFSGYTYKDDFKLNPREINEYASHLLVCRLDAIAAVNYDFNIGINWGILTHDGTEIIGPTGLSTTNQALDKIIHVPIVFNNSINVKSGSFDLKFNQDIFEFSGYDDLLTTSSLNVDTSDIIDGILHINFSFDEEKTLVDSITNLRFSNKIELEKLPDYYRFNLNNQIFYNNTERVFMNISEPIWRKRELKYRPANEVATLALVDTESDNYNYLDEISIDVSNLFEEEN